MMTSAEFLQLAVSLSLQITAVVAFTHFAGRLIDEPRVQSRMWTACFALIIALSGSALSLPHLQIAQPLEMQSMRTNAELANLESSIGSVMFRIWFAGIVFSLGLFLYRSMQMSRFLRSCEPLRPDFVRLLTSSGAQADLSFSSQGRPVMMITSRAVSSPFCWQFHVPYIVLPERLLTYERDELRLVLQHELEHLGTGHPLQMFLQRSVEILFWFHPMVWWASHQAALTREFVCDDAATSQGPEIVAYLKTLLRIAEETLSGSEPVRAGCHSGGIGP